jgi:hypothetical protein
LSRSLLPCNFKLIRCNYYQGPSQPDMATEFVLGILFPELICYKTETIAKGLRYPHVQCLYL